MVLSEDSIWGWMILKPFLKTWNIPRALIQYLAPKKLGRLFFFSFKRFPSVEVIGYGEQNYL